MLMKMRVPHYYHVINRNHGSGGDLREDERHNSSVRPSLHQPGASLSGGDGDGDGDGDGLLSLVVSNRKI